MANFTFKHLSIMELNEGVQIRLKTNAETVQRYKEAIEEKHGTWPFPPIDVYCIDGEYHIADGHHRWQAALAAGLKTVSCIVHDGTQEDLLKTAFKGNKKNALQMTDADLKHGRELAILKYPHKSDRDLAEICDCSPMTINRAKKELEAQGRFERPETIIGRDGKERKSTVTMLQYKAKQDFNIEDFRKQCLEIRDEAAKEFYDLDRGEADEDSTEERAAFKAKLEAQKREFEEKWKWTQYIKKPVDDTEIYLFSECMGDVLYFAYFISLKNGQPELLVKGWKDCPPPKKPFFYYTVKRHMTPAEYLKTELEEQEAETETANEPCKCNFLQELWAFKVIEEYKRITA
ncbi:MAG: ParB N-terminal domain-containing protein [Thermoguttaceae bacterium]|nr:ParB N-terminal domain-containing protein [Thermoguttaceae bacterium]